MSDYFSESSESSQEQSSEASEDSFVSVSEDFLPYDEISSRLPRNQKRLKIGGKCMAQEEEEDEILWSRFSGEEDVEHCFSIIFVIFVSLVDRKRFCGPLTIVERFTQSTLQISLPDMYMH